ncbi:hypothetical protein BDQ17DRAFT_1336667 [Cyathus striatus]|nr:hypothetical protein BDQ17DRAFT_1336667 [Cyathus striatus]
MYTKFKVVSSLVAAAELGIQAHTRDFSIFPAWWTPLGAAAFCLSLAVNAIVTLLMVFKIWTRGRTGSDTKSKSVHTIVPMLLESAVLVFIAQVLFVAFFELRHVGWYVVSTPVIMIYGINPTIVIMRTIGIQKNMSPDNVGVGSTTQVISGPTSSEEKEKEEDILDIV